MQSLKDWQRVGLAAFAMAICSQAIISAEGSFWFVGPIEALVLGIFVLSLICAVMIVASGYAAQIINRIGIPPWMTFWPLLFGLGMGATYVSLQAPHSFFSWSYWALKARDEFFMSGVATAILFIGRKASFS